MWQVVMTAAILDEQGTPLVQLATTENVPVVPDDEQQALVAAGMLRGSLEDAIERTDVQVRSVLGKMTADEVTALRTRPKGGHR